MEPTRNTPQIRAGLVAVACTLACCIGMYQLLTLEIPPERTLSTSLMMGALVVFGMLGATAGTIELRDGMVRTFRDSDGAPADPVDVMGLRTRELEAAESWAELTSAK